LARLATLLAALLLLWVPLAHAQSPSAGPDLLAASLLADDDLPGFAGRDIEDPTDLDVDRLAFDEHGGVDARIRAWVSQEQGVVFDYRMLLPTADDARAYLAAAEPTLSEADDAGLVLDAADPLTPGTRHWAGETRIGDEPVAMDVWLIPVGPVVAKVAVTVFGPGLDLRRAIAERALARLEAAYGPADAGMPSGSPGASPIASSTSDIELLQGLVLPWTEPDPPTLGAILARPLADLATLWESARFVVAAPAQATGLPKRSSPR
jgi:hypothetical protein